MSIRTFALAAILILITCTSVIYAQPVEPHIYFSDYIYISDHEQTPFNEIIWFWYPDILHGDVHSNDNIAIKGNPTFFGNVSTSGVFAQGPGFNPDITGQLCEGMLIHEFENISIVPAQEMATTQGYYYSNTNPDDPMQYKLVGEDTGWRLEAWSDTLEYDSTNIAYQEMINYNNPEDDWLALFVEGRLQLHGINIEGQNLIGANGEIKLMDDLLVEGTEFGVIFDIDPTNQNKIAIYGNEALVIADTYPNGRANRTGTTADTSDIMITACMVLPDSSMTIEHQNDDWDDYVYCRDVNPNSEDERGQIMIFGSLIQHRRGYVHRSNCGGTGYNKFYQYDERWLENPPPGIGACIPEYLDLSNMVINNENLTIEYNYFIDDGDSLTLGPGAELLFTDNRSIRFGEGSKLIINGSPENPVRIMAYDERTRPIFLDVPYPEEYSDIEAYTWKNIEIYTDCDTLVVAPFLKNVKLVMEGEENKSVLMAGEDITKTIDWCTLTGNLDIQSPAVDDAVLIRNSLASGRLTLSQNTTFERCVFHSNEETMYNVALRSDRNIFVTSSFFLGDFDYGFVAQADSGCCEAHYCGYYMFGTNFNPNFDFMIEFNEMIPNFVNADEGDYHLLATSPLIDSGSFFLEPDPDGTRADIGIYHFPQDNHFNEVDDQKTSIPESFAVLGPYPNPFNHTTRLTVQLAESSPVNIAVFDLLGRQVSKHFIPQLSPGYKDISLNLDGLSAGVYLVEVKTNTESQIVKAVLMK